MYNHDTIKCENDSICLYSVQTIIILVHSIILTKLHEHCIKLIEVHNIEILCILKFIEISLYSLDI